MISSEEPKIRFDSPLSRTNGQTVSTGFNSRERGGSGRSVMLSGTQSLGERCQPAWSRSSTACEPRRVFRRPFGLGHAAKAGALAWALERASALAGGTLPMGSSRRRLLNQSTPLERGELDGFEGPPWAPPLDHLGLDQ